MRVWYIACLVCLVGLVGLVGIAGAYPVVLSNENGTGIRLIPSPQVYFWIPDTIDFLHVTVDSNYVVLSKIPIEVDSSAGHVDVYINMFEPDYIEHLNYDVLNFTISAEYPETHVTLYVGNLSNAALLVYKDGKLYYGSRADEFHKFIGNDTVESGNTFEFNDGATFFSSLTITPIGNMTDGYNVIRGTIQSVSSVENQKAVQVIVKDNSGFAIITFDYLIPLQPGDDAIVKLYKAGNVLAPKWVYVNPYKIGTHFSNHTYLFRTTPHEVVSAVLAPPAAPAIDVQQIINYASYAIAGIIAFLVLVVVVGRIKRS